MDFTCISIVRQTIGSHHNRVNRTFGFRDFRKCCLSLDEFSLIVRINTILVFGIFHLAKVDDTIAKVNLEVYLHTFSFLFFIG